uniref:CRISPR-associated endonuclease Cas9 n=1 Tax=Endomicrobium trichonymphae TaxID=1408204 RepID=A0A1C9ZTA2_ENDTX|nr:CRISPR-associated protein cas9 [Candidatus Endomicrobium trichonymphae]
MKKRILGLDIGIASVGWALIEFDDEFQDNKKKGTIIKSGVRIFTRAETPKEREPLAKPRREARSQRRRISCRVERLNFVRELFVKNGLVAKESVNKNNPNNIYITLNQIKTPWQLRMEALDRKLTNEEFAVVLTHLAKHRGYKSLRKTDSKDNKTGEMLKAINQNKERLDNSDYRTLGEMFCKHESYKEHKRNKDGEYINSVTRELIEEEAEKIFAKQRKEGNNFADVDIEREYLKIAFSQKPTGSINKMVGFCTFENGEKRAPRDSYSAELFKVLNTINNTTITDMKTGETRNFTGAEIKKIIEIIKDTKGITYVKIKKELKLGSSQFSGVDYRENAKSKGEGEIFVSMKTYHEIKSKIEKLSKEKWNKLKENTELLDSIVNIIANFKDDESIKKEFQKLKIDEDIIDVLLNFEFKKFINLSFKALRKIIPFQFQGQKYITASMSVGYSLKQEGIKNKFLRVPSQEENVNVPVVARAFAQTRKVINAVIREYGQFDQINIELATDLKNSKFDRSKIEKGQKEFQSQKDKVFQEVQDLTGEIIPSSSLLLKYRLWREQDERCIYSGRKISRKDLLDTGFLDIDHIIPYSKSMDDGFNNKVLCLAEENRNKKNDIPFNYYQRIGRDWNFLISIIASMKNMKYVKKKRLLKQELSDIEIESFIERNINDTRYATRYIKNFLENNLEFKENEFIKAKVQARHGGLTSVLRYNWGISKNREESYLHHAKDAITVACSTQGMVQYISNISQKYENGKYKMKQIKERTENRIPKPWDSFKDDVERSINDIFVSFAPRHKVTGSAHKETIYSKKHLEKGYVTIKKSLDKIKLSDLKNIPCDENCDIIRVLKERLEKFNDDSLKAFADPVHMPTKCSNKKGPIIRSVKIKENNKTGIEVRKGLVERGDMVRVDVFIKDKKYYLVPIYVSDFKNKDLPNKAIVSSKSENEWIMIDKTYSFKFSLFKDDLIKIKNKKGEIFGYLGGVHRLTGGINIKSCYKPKEKDGNIGSKCLLDFRKFQVGILGDYNEVKHEKRMPAYINTKKDKEH